MWTPQAERHLDEAVAYIARDSRAGAEGLLTAALAAAASLEILSERGRTVPELRLAAVREIMVRRRYRLIYAVGEEEVTILAFLHGARDLRRLLRREGPRD